MGVELVDEALPIDPDIEGGAARVVEQLEARLGIGREVELGVIKRLDEAMVGAAVEVAKDDVDLRREGHAGAEVGQQVHIVARGLAAPDGNVVVSKSRVTVRAPEPEGVYAGFDGHTLRGAIDEAGLQAEAGHGVALGCVSGALGVAEEVEVIHL